MTKCETAASKMINDILMIPSKSIEEITGKVDSSETPGMKVRYEVMVKMSLLSSVFDLDLHISFLERLGFVKRQGEVGSFNRWDVYIDDNLVSAVLPSEFDDVLSLQAAESNIEKMLQARRAKMDCHTFLAC